MFELLKIRDVFTFFKKSKIKAGAGLEYGQYPFYTSSSIVSKYLNSYEIEDEALIFGTGGNASIHYSVGKFSASTDCLVLKNNNINKINSKYVYLFLKGNIYILERGFKGAGLKHISKKYIEDIKIPVPSLSTQQKIVQVLDKAQALIDKRKEQVSLLNELTESIFYQMFGDPIKNEKGWEVKKFGDYIEVLSDYHANGSYKILREKVELLDKKSYALMVRTIDLENNNYDENVKYIDKSAYDFLEKSKVYAGDIIINKIGSAGSVYIMPDLQQKVSLGMNQFLIRTNSKLKHIYLFYLFNTVTGEKIIKSKIKGTVTKTINKDAIRNIKILAPPLSLQKEFAGKVEAIEVQKERLENSLKLLEDNYNNLMQRAFKGELFD